MEIYRQKFINSGNLLQDGLSGKEAGFFWPFLFSFEGAEQRALRCLGRVRKLTETMKK
jgi:hypothetical protein